MATSAEGGDVSNSHQESENLIRASRVSMDDSRMVMQRQSKPEQRLILFCHLFFKLLAFFLYIFKNQLGMGFRLAFVVVLLVLCVDFWIGKNLSGRLLAGLRWWSVTDPETGKMNWRFEQWSREERQVAVSSQVNWFWAALVLQQVFWQLMQLVSIVSFSFGWFVFTSIACCLNGANLYGYIRCRLQSREKSPGLFSRMGDAFVGLFKTSGGEYTRGQAVSGF